MSPDHDDDAFHRELRRAVRALPDAPVAWQRAALDLWPASGAADVARAAWRLVSAVLTFDSWAQPATALGMRGSAAAPRHLLYTAEGRDIDLRVLPGASGYTLSGQVLGPDAEGELELQPRGARAALDELGGFRFEGVARGVYQLTLRVGGDRIELPALDVGEAPR